MTLFNQIVKGEGSQAEGEGEGDEEAGDGEGFSLKRAITMSEKLTIPVKTALDNQKMQKQFKQDNARVAKWKLMLEVYPIQVHKKMVSRGRKGIPDSFRGHAWCILT
mmetsp:Transcript_8655/g.14671  ORF Transcript_8655/g.14671 Transcript_8655/m.14671 type:complete len:107 (+) Transcript_8655:732-1052(+)